MARTPLMSKVQLAAAEAAAGTTRREALTRAGAAAAGLMLARPWLPLAQAATAPRIVVVGGGLAGLTAAYRLKQAGYAAQLFEASDRAGGRCWTIRGAFADGQIAEHGGELIDTGHIEMKQLVQELGLDLDNLAQAEQQGTETFAFFDGAPYSYTDATNDLKAIWQQIHSDVSAASYPTQWNLNTQRGRELDAMSIIDWIKAYVPGGTSSKLGQLLDVAYNIEYGGECSVQSSLNMLYLLGYSGQGQLRIFGPSNEKYHVRGGNDQIPAGLAARLSGQITMGSSLVALKPGAAADTWTGTLRQGSSTTDVTADHVVLALPFSILRSAVDLKRAGFPTRKTT